LLWGFPAGRVLVAILRLLPQVMLHPSYTLIFMVVLGLVAMQYRRIALTEEKLYGRVKNPPLRQTLLGLGFGFLGGIFASFLLALIGVPLRGSGLIYLWPVAVLLFLINPRLMCFSYAGGLLSIASLALGFPDINVPALMGLVGVLHVTESLLIAATGATCVTPLYLRNRRGKTVGGLSLQRFWLVPLVVIVVVFIPQGTRLHGALEMPDWWPLLGGTEGLQVPPGRIPAYTMLPVLAALGYSDVAVISDPRRKAQRSATNLAFYSLSLLALAILSARHPWVRWLAAAYAALGHEMVVLLGSYWELRSDPRRPVGPGVLILDVFPDTPAARSGLRPGDQVVAVDGHITSTREELRALLATTHPPYTLAVLSPGDQEPREIVISEPGRLGVVPFPDADDRAQVQLRTGGILVRWWRKWRRRR